MQNKRIMFCCDDVFFVLTGGPFPTGKPTDALVEHHLAECESCRRLAEALRPAESLVPEAVTPEESRALPSYRGGQATIEPRVLSAVLADFEYGHDVESRLQTRPFQIEIIRRSVAAEMVCRYSSSRDGAVAS